MKKRMHGVSAAIAAVALVSAFGLFGCGSGGEAPAESSAAPEAAPTETAPAETSAAAEPAEGTVLQIFAANSLEKALPEVQALYTASHPDVTFADTQFKGSGDLVTDLEGGAAADLLITASAGTMEDAVADGFVAEGSEIDMFQNDLVICAAEGSDVVVQDVADLASNEAIESIAIGEPNAVPAGKYAVQTLESAGLCTSETDDDGVMTVEWGADIADKMNAGADKVGTVAQYVADGSSTVGFVYTSDIYRYDGIASIFTVPADMHKDIKYPGAVLTMSDKGDVASDFLNFCLTDPDALQIFSEYGFEMAA